MKRRNLLTVIVIILAITLMPTALAETDVCNPKGVFPIVKEGQEVTLSVFIAKTGLISTYEAPTNKYTQWLEDQTGVKLTFVTAPSGDDATTKLNLLLNSGDYPDMIFNGFDRDTSNMYAEEGIFINLDPFYDTYADELINVFEQYPGARTIATDAQGHLIGIANVNDCLHCNVANGRAWYYRPFLEATGLDQPETTADLKELLIAIRDQDVNGNGDPNDEIPMAFAKGELGTARRWISNSFLPYPETGYAIIDGKVEAQFIKDEFRQSIAYMADLYKEGLILPNSFSIDGDELIRYGEAEYPLLGVVPVAWANSATEKFGQSGRFFDLLILNALEGPDGVRYQYQKGDMNPVSNRAYVTDKCQYPEVAFRLLDFMKGFEPTMNGYIGPKGECWDDPDVGALGLNGEPAKYKLLVNYGVQPMDAGWDQANPDFRSSDFRLGEQATGIDEIFDWLENGDYAMLEKVKDLPAYNEAVNYYFAVYNEEYLLPQEYILPSMIFTAEDSATVADILASLNPYLDVAYVEFITGVRDINDDAAWDNYVAEVQGMGLDTVCEIYTNSL